MQTLKISFLCSSIQTLIITGLNLILNKGRVEWGATLLNFAILLIIFFVINYLFFNFLKDFKAAVVSTTIGGILVTLSFFFTWPTGFLPTIGGTSLRLTNGLPLPFIGINSVFDFNPSANYVIVSAVIFTLNVYLVSLFLYIVINIKNFNYSSSAKVSLRKIIVFIVSLVLIMGTALMWYLKLFLPGYLFFIVPVVFILNVLLSVILFISILKDLYLGQKNVEMKFKRNLLFMGLVLVILTSGIAVLTLPNLPILIDHPYYLFIQSQRNSFGTF